MRRTYKFENTLTIRVKTIGKFNVGAMFEKYFCANCRFAEPNGVPPRRTMTVEFSPGRESSPSNRKSISPRYRKELLHRISTDSISSDFSDDGFAENVILPSAGSVLVRTDADTVID